MEIVAVYISYMLLFESFQALLSKSCVGMNGTTCCAGFQLDLTQKKCLACTKGYMGFSCESKCPFPFYGHGCQSECNCIDKDCDHANGCRQSSRDLGYKIITTEVLNSKVHTSEPCEKGYNGTNCEHACPFPSYGVGCQRKCNCIDKVCDHINGCMQPTRDKKNFQDNISPSSTSIQRKTVTAYIKSEVNTFENSKADIDKKTPCTMSNQETKRNDYVMFALIGLSIVALIIVLYFLTLD